MLFIDIETLPSLVPPSVDDIKAPANYKDADKIAAYIEAAKATAHAETALDPLKGRIASIAWAIDDGPVEFVWATDHSEEEGDIDALAPALGMLYETMGPRPYTHEWCAYNAGFDTRWLFLHARRIGHPLGSCVPSQKFDKRVIDPAEMAKGIDPRGNMPRQRDLAAFFGLRVDTSPGSAVWGHWQAGEYDAIKAHNIEDVQTLRTLYAKLRGKA